MKSQKKKRNKLGRAKTPELEEIRRAKIGASSLGRKLSEKVKARLSQIAIEQGRKPPYFWQDTTGIHPLLGKHHSQETLEKIRQGNLGKSGLVGKNHPLYGKPRSAETRAKIATSLIGQQCPPNSYAPAALKKISEKAKKRWADPEFKARAVKAVFEASQVQPNKAEQFLTDFFQTHNLPFKYVGDGEFILGGKCPDFLNTDGRKQLIELFGAYWHPESDVIIRTKHFAQYGFETLIIWENELSNTEELLEKVKIFVEEKEE